ncbi:MAG TPA: hypothetical protein ENL02_04670 [Epsilonproteobacteria bacterium]|nr:hypothetical protein [Campylobacterota bacterium]
MKIRFEKVGQLAKPFHAGKGGVVLEGTLQKSEHHRVILQGETKGSIAVACNRCGASFNYEMSDPLRLTISDRIIESKDDLDIIEFLDGEIDISFILQSEINTIKSEYHYCKKCQKNEEAFEMEF